MLNLLKRGKGAQRMQIAADPTGTRDDLAIRDLMDFPSLRQAMGLPLDHEQPELQRQEAAA